MTPTHHLANAEVAGVLERVADRLQAQDANPFQVRAWRQAAATVAHWPRPIADVLDREGPAGLRTLPGIGYGLAAAIEEIAVTGSLAMLERMEGRASPEDLFTTVPGIGDALASRIHARLGVETLEDLETAAHDGRLATVPGFGPRRVRAVCETLAARLSRSGRRRALAPAGAALSTADAALPPAGAALSSADAALPPASAATRLAADEPPVALLLDADAEYRRRADAGDLRRIAPRRFNPGREAWLPILHTERAGWFINALHSNTAQAHRLGRTHDWVVLYCSRDGEERRYTVVTETQGAERGRRVVRGREAECAALEDAADSGLAGA